MTGKIVLAVVILLLVAAFDTFWIEGMQPAITTETTMHQFEVYKDGTGDKLAAERRIINRVSSKPPVVVTGVGILFVLSIFAKDIRDLLQGKK